MGQFSKVLQAIDNEHTVPDTALDCGPGLGRLNQVRMPHLDWQPSGDSKLHVYSGSVYDLASIY